MEISKEAAEALRNLDTGLAELTGRLEKRAPASERDAPLIPFLQSTASNALAVRILFLGGVRWALIANARTALEAATDAVYFAMYEPRVEATARCYLFEIYEFALLMADMDADSNATPADVDAVLAKAKDGPLAKAAATETYDPEFAAAIRKAADELELSFREARSNRRHVPHWSTKSYYKRAEVVGGAIGGIDATRLRLTYSLLSRGVHARMRAQERSEVGLDGASVLVGTGLALRLGVVAFDRCFR